MLHISKMPLVSVIIPNYNNSQYLRECIDSVLRQTYERTELIICDDNSTDNSVHIIDEYFNKYPRKVRPIYRKIKSGVSCNRHDAIIKSSGDYITTLDSDDYYFDDLKLEKEMKIIIEKRNKNNKNVCVFSNIVLVYRYKMLNRVVGTFENIKEGKILNEILARSCFIPRDYIFPRTEYMDIGGFDGSLNIYEDWDLKIRLAANNEFYYSGINGIAYRQHGNGLSSSPLVDHVEALQKIFIKNIHLVKSDEQKAITDQFETYINQIQNKTNSCNSSYMYKDSLKCLQKKLLVVFRKSQLN